MEWLDVLRRVERGEDERTEFKRGLGDLGAVGKTLCAFANGEGGLVVIGIDDSGTIVGTKEDPDTVQERLTGFLHSGCGKPITAECARFHTDDGWVHWIEVHRHQRGYEPFSHDGRFWVRRGRSTAAPSPSEMQELFNAFGFIFTEKRTVSSATARDIDADAFRSFMQAQGKRTEGEPQPDIDQDLSNASVCDWLDGALRPTLYGLMVFGRDPQGHPHTTSLFIQCAAYAGTHRASDVLSAGEGKGRLDEQVNRSMGWFRSLGRRESYRGPYREDIPLLPEEVLREALVNAVIHRDYALTGVAGPAGGVRRSYRRDESRSPPESHDGRAGTFRWVPTFAQRDDGERDGGQTTDGTARPRMAAHATPHEQVQRHRTRADQRRGWQICPGDVPSEARLHSRRCLNRPRLALWRGDDEQQPSGRGRSRPPDR